MVFKRRTTMDPVSVIVAAWAAAAPMVAQGLCKEVVSDGYKKLKKLIHDATGSDSPVTKALAAVEAEPDSRGQQIVLSEKISQAGLAEHPEIVNAAQALLDRVKQQPGGEQHILKVVGNYNATADHDSTATVNIYKAPRD
jgi:hypothetical protein